jgi:ribosomal protein L11 methyltransferase
MIGTNAFDLVLANINRNVLLQDLNAYFRSLRNKGNLLISGFYIKDIDVLKEEAARCGFHFAGSGNLNDWAVLLFYK